MPDTPHAPDPPPEDQLARLRAALMEGESSGDAGPLDLAAIKAQARRLAGLAE